METSSVPTAAASRVRPLVIGVILCLLTFLATFGPMRFRQRSNEATLADQRLTLQLSDAHRLLGMAAIQSEQNNFLAARSSAGDFFDAIRRLLSGDQLANEDPRVSIALTSYLSERDTITSQLAQNDPAAVLRLGSLYLTMDGVLRRRAISS